ncbi:topology modulation protein [compost metagenome]
MVELGRISPRKIHIIGSVGSGKTTFARNLSHKLNIPHYELDNVVWKRAYPRDIKRTEEERDGLLRTIINSSSWIIEGAQILTSSRTCLSGIKILKAALNQRLYIN